MRIIELLWKEQFVEKMERKHKVATDEVGQVFARAPHFSLIAKGDIAGENVIGLWGGRTPGATWQYSSSTSPVAERCPSRLVTWTCGSGKSMGKRTRKKRKPEPLPKRFDTVEEAGEFWDTHSSADYENYATEAHFDVALKGRVHEVRVTDQVLREVRKLARQRGVATETLVNLWLQEKVAANRHHS